MLNERPPNASLSPLTIDAPSRGIHLALAACVAAALVSGQFAGDYKSIVHPGYSIHRWIGVCMAAALCARVLWGFVGPRAMHEGLAGLVQAIGLIAFAWMAVTGVILFAWLEPGARAAGWMRVVKELHEGGQAVVYGFIALHLGAVVFHALVGDDTWRHMFFLRRRDPQRP